MKWILLVFESHMAHLNAPENLWRDSVLKMEKNSSSFNAEMIIKMEPDALSSICDSTVSTCIKGMFQFLCTFVRKLNYQIFKIEIECKQTKDPASWMMIQNI